MKKGSAIGIIIIFIIVGIRWFLKIDYVIDNHVVEETIKTIQKEDLELDAFTGEEKKYPEENENVEGKNEKEETVFLDDYPIYGVIENDYGDEIISDDEDPELQETEKLLLQALNDFSNEMEQKEKILNIAVAINGKNYQVELENNETAQSFYDNILSDSSSEFIMEELNGNEKYVYLPVGTLPTAAKVPAEIQAGDIMLYGNNCIVIFYKTFTTNYSYTKIGHIKNMEDLGAEDVKVIFSRL